MDAELSNGDTIGRVLTGVGGLFGLERLPEDDEPCECSMGSGLELN